MATKRRSNRKVDRGRRKKKGFSSWSLGKKIGVITISILLVLVIGGGAAAAAYVTSKVDRMEVKQLDAQKLEINQEVEHKTGYLNVALFGVDSREASLGKGTRSDTIMIASLNQETGEVKISSVYRDTLLQQSDGSYNKANAAYSFGGVEGAVALLNKNLDMNIEHYVTVNFNALIDAIDALGGIELELTEEEVFWTNGYCEETSRVSGHTYTDLAGSGLMTLDGVQATSFCRIRYTKGDDFKRTERQRMVIQKVVEKLQTANLATINKIIDEVFDEVGTNFTLPEILSYAKDFKKYKLGETVGFPYNVSTGTLSGIGSTVIPTSFTSDVQQLHQFFFGDDGYTPSETVQNIAAGIQKKSTDIGKGTTKDEDSYYDDDSSGSSSKNSKKSSSGSSNSGTSSGSSGSGNSSGSGSSGGSKSDSGSGGGSGSGSSGSSSGGGSESGGSGSGGSSSGGGSESGGSSSGGGESSGGESAE